MATIFHFGPYYYYPPGGMAVGSAYNVAWGPDDRFDGCTANVSGTPNPHLRNTLFAVWVSDMSIAATDVGHGDIGNFLFTLYTTFGNSGQEVVNTFTAWVTITKP